MTSQDFLFLSLGTGFLILAGFISYAAYHLAQSLKTLKLILENAEDVSEDIDKLKNTIKFGLLDLLRIFSRRRR
ncbi:MAG: hypothetical protein PHQ59_04980 [Candidatus Daviesbacteria bacterium]|nr:hypothetical protein [Candidatus Daviesbacteria bacterium]